MGLTATLGRDEERIVVDDWMAGPCGGHQTYTLAGGVTFGLIDTGLSDLTMHFTGENTVYKNADIDFNDGGMIWDNQGTITFNNPGYTVYFTGSNQQIGGNGTYIVRTPVNLQANEAIYNGTWKLYDNLNINGMNSSSGASLRLGN